MLVDFGDIDCWTGVVWIACGLLWCFYQLFGLSFWRHPFTAEDPLVSKWWNAMFLIWNKLIYILDSLRVSAFSAKFNFGVNYSFNSLQKFTTTYKRLYLPMKNINANQLLKLYKLNHFCKIFHMCSFFLAW